MIVREKSTVTQTTLTPTITKLTENLHLSTLPVSQCLRREMLCWSQCSKQVTSLEEQTSRTGRIRQHNWLYPGYSPTS